MYLDCISDLPVLGVRTPKQWIIGKERKWHSTVMAIEEEERVGGDNLWSVKYLRPIKKLEQIDVYTM
jgi:hypothetical protein